MFGKRVLLTGIFLSGLGLTLSGGLPPQARAAESVPEKIVPSRFFVVTVKPTNDESKDAEGADLYITRFPQKGWVLDGPCKVRPGEKEMLFARAVTVPSDGAYYFTSRGQDAVGKSPAPLAGASAQIKVIADTTPPKMNITAPAPGVILRAGEPVRVEWDADDANLAAYPVKLEYSLDEGRSWSAVGEKLPNSGHHAWKVPQESGQMLLLRGSCLDRAGNRGLAVPEGGWKILPRAKPEVFSETTAPKMPEAPQGKAPASLVDAEAPQLKDPRPVSKHPELDANNAEIATLQPNEGRAAYIAYIMGGNLVRQGRLKDSLRYYRTAIDIDPNFDEAWNDMALVYKELGAYARADACIVRALNIEPENLRYLNTRAGTYQAAAFEILRDPSAGEESLARSSDLVLFAVKTYGKAVDTALRQGRLAECAETYFHLGEICYFANQDPQGARQYWVKVLDLHTPTPDLDNVIFDRDTPQERLTRTVYEKNTEMWVDLKTWQSWAREYLVQLNKLESGAAVPKAPFTSSYFQRFANPQTGLNSVPGPTAAGGAAFGLNPNGNYGEMQLGTVSGSPAGYPPMPGTQVLVPQAGVPGQYGLQGQVGPQMAQQRAYVAVQQGNSVPTYERRGAVAAQNEMVNKSLPPQGAWLGQNYGNAPGYTYQTTGAY